MPTTHSPARSADRRSPAFLVAYALANAGGAIGYLPLLSLLMPVKVEAIAGGSRLVLLAQIAVTGALAASGANIAFGWLSDRSLAAGGGRRRWVAGGVVATALSYLGLIVAASPITVIGAIIAFQIAVNALLAPLAAIMADEIPDEQKGIAGGLLALAAPGASTLTAVLVGLSGLDEAAQALPVRRGYTRRRQPRRHGAGAAMASRCGGIRALHR